MFQHTIECYIFWWNISYFSVKLSWLIKDRPVIVPFMRIFLRRIFIKGLNLITSTSPRFKKFLSPLISLDFRRNFTKCVIQCAMFIISRTAIQSPYWYKNYAWTVSLSPKLWLNAKRFFKCIKNTRSPSKCFFHFGS